MQALPEALLAEIFNYTVHVDSFIRCSTVCKSWARAIRTCRPKRLIVQSFRHDQWELDAAVSTIKWLHLWQQQGSLREVQQLVLDTNLLDPQYRRSLSPSPLSQAVIAAASFCHLQICILRGPFSLATAIALLPANLLVLDLWPESIPAGTLLSHFAKFNKANLQSLKLRCGTRNPDSFIDPCLWDLRLDSPFRSLTTLEISNLFCFKPLSGSTLGDRLINLRKCTLNLQADKPSIQLAQALIVQPHMEDLELELFNVVHSSACISKLTVPDGSSVNRLKITGPKITPSILIDLAKASPAHEFCRVQVHIR